MIRIEAGRILLGIRYEDKEYAKAIGCRWDPSSAQWWTPASTISAEAVIETFGHAYRVSPEVTALAEAIQARPQLDLDRPVPITVEAMPPWKPQREAFWFALESFKSKDSAGVLFDMAMGTGKSRVVVDLIQNMNARRALIFAPSSAVAVWPFQVLRWAVHVDDWQVTVLGDSKPDDTEEPLPARWTFCKTSVAKRVKAMYKSSARGAEMRHNVVVVNWEACWRTPMAAALLEQEWDLVVGDEIHRIKSPSGKQSKFAGKLAKTTNARKRIGMSGTPMPHSPLDAYGVMRFVDEKLFGSSVTLFRNRFLYINPYIGNGNAIAKNPQSGDWFKDRRIRSDFELRYGTVTYRAEKDLESLPPLVEEYRWAELDPGASMHYDELRKDLMTVVRAATKGRVGGDAVDAVVSSANAMVLVTRLQQVLCGHMVDEDRNTIPISDSKQNALIEVLSDIPQNEPVVVFARFVHDLDRIQSAAVASGRTYGEVSGRRKDVRAKWRASQDFNVLGVQVQSGSVGVDYTLACYSVFWSIWGGGDFAQARDRIHRPPQKRSVTQISLVTKPVHGHQAVDYTLMQGLLANEDALRTIARNAVKAAWEK